MEVEDILKNSLSSKGLCSQDKVMAKGIPETQTCHVASANRILIPALGQLHLDRPGYMVLPHSACSKKNYISTHTQQEREQQ